MSLISEALKEAQRERTQRSGPRTAPQADTFFPFAPDEKPRRANRSVIIGGVALVLLAIAGAAGVRYWKSHATRRVAASLPRFPAVSAPPVVSPSSVPDTTASAATAAAPSSTVPPASTTPTVAAPTVVAGPTSAKSAGANTAGAKSSGSTPANAATSTPEKAGAIVDRPKQKPVATESAVSIQGAQTGDRAASPKDSLAIPRSTALPASSSSVKQQVVPPADVRVIVSASAAKPVDSLFKQAYAEQMRGNLERAQELYEKIIALPEAPADAYNNYGVLLSARGNQFGASQMFQQALKRDEKNVNALVNLGDSFNAMGHHGEAVSAFARAAQLDASNTAVKIRLAAEYRAIGDTVSARHMYEDATRIAPSDPVAHYEFGKFLQSQRSTRDALAEFQKFIELAPGKYPAETIDGVRKYVATLRRLSP